MPLKVCMGATLSCSYGTAPSTFIVLPIHHAYIEDKPVANISDSISYVNIVPFGMCTSRANPEVSSATMAALGIPTPMPCMPSITGPWSPGASKNLVGGLPTLHAGCTCNCMWGGEISILDAGQISEEVE